MVLGGVGSVGVGCGRCCGDVGGVWNEALWEWGVGVWVMVWGGVEWGGVGRRGPWTSTPLPDQPDVIMCRASADASHPCLCL